VSSEGSGDMPDGDAPRKLAPAEYEAASAFRAAAERRQMRIGVFISIAAPALFMAAVAVCLIWPHLLAATVGAAAALGIAIFACSWIALRNCPVCGRLYPLKNLELCHAESGSYQSAGEYGVYSVEFTNLVYRTKCDRCGAGIWIWKWKRGAAGSP